MKHFKWAIVLSLAVVCLLLLLGRVVIHQSKTAYDNLPVLYSIPDFNLFQTPETVVNRSVFIGKISIVDFIFTSCPGPCPVMSGNMKTLYEDFGDQPDVQFISISVDPENDTFEELARYRAGFGVNDNRWIFLRGPITDVAELCENGFKLAAEGLPGGHTIKFVLVDRAGNSRGYYDGTDLISLANLKKAVIALLDEPAS